MLWRAVVAPTPITTGTRPATRFMAISAMVRRSSDSSAQFSPLLPAMQSPSAFLASNQSTTWAKASPIRSPPSLNGVTAAAMNPSMVFPLAMDMSSPAFD